MNVRRPRPQLNFSAMREETKSKGEEGDQGAGRQIFPQGDGTEDRERGAGREAGQIYKLHSARGPAPHGKVTAPYCKHVQLRKAHM